MSYQAVQALLSKGISRPTLFQVIMPVSFGANRQLEFLCKEATVPEISTNVINANGHEAMGVVREQPTSIMYAKPFSITVISDRDYIVYKEIRRWFNTIAQNANPNLFDGFTGSSQRVNYFDSFAKTITLKKLEQNGDQRYYQPFQVDFNKAYPVRIGDISLSSEAYDGKVEFQVDFTYETYTFQDSNELSVFS